MVIGSTTIPLSKRFDLAHLFRLIRQLEDCRWMTPISARFRRMAMA